MQITIASLTFDTIIGILEHERHTPQRVIIDCVIEYDFRGGYIDYAAVADRIKHIMIREKFELIEEALDALQRKIFSDHPNINTLSLKITKPDILGDCDVSVGETYKF